LPHKTVQALLRHSNVGTTLKHYTHAVTASMTAAQTAMLEAMKVAGPVV
jgi:hypothetical protein